MTELEEKMEKINKYLKRAYNIGKNVPNGVNYDSISDILSLLVIEAEFKDNITVSFDALSREYASGFYDVVNE